MLRAMTFRAHTYRYPAAAPEEAPRSIHLEHLILLPSFPAPATARDRLEDALGHELATFLIAALSGSQGRGVSSPQIRTNRKIAAPQTAPSTNEVAPETPTATPPNQM